VNDRISKLERAISELEGRIRSLEAHAPGEDTSASKPLTKAVPPEVSWTGPVPPSVQNDSEVVGTRSGGNFLAAAGILFFLLAASFLIKLAVDSGWLTPIRQLVGAFSFGLILIGAGFRVKAKDLAYATFLPAAGISIIFMCGFAGHLYFELYDAQLAMLFVAVTALFSLFLFTVFKHDVFLITAVCGTYLVPVLIGSYRIDPMAVRGYFLFWGILFSICSIKLGRRLLIGLTAYISIGLWQCLFEASGSQDLSSAIYFQVAQFLLLGFATAVFSVVRNKTLTAFEGWALLPVLILFYAVEYSMALRLYPEAAPWIALGFAAMVYFLYFSTASLLQRETLESSPMIATFISFAVFHAVYIELLPERFMPWFGLLIALVSIGVIQKKLDFDRFWPAYYIVWLAVICEYFRVLLLDSTYFSNDFIVLNFIIFSLAFFAYLKIRVETYGGIILFFTHLQALRGLDRLADLITGPAQSHFVTSGLWAMFALGLLLFSQSRKDALLARSSMLIFGLVAGKVLLFDISGTGSFARIVALVFIGGLLYSGGLIWRRIGEWDKEPSVEIKPAEN